MGVLDDICAVAGRLGERLETASRAIDEWAATEVGQSVLATLDFAVISSRLGDFYAHTGWYLPVHPALHRYALEHVEYHCPFDARDAARLVGPGSSHWPWIVEGALVKAHENSPLLLMRIPHPAGASGAGFRSTNWLRLVARGPQNG